MKPEDFHPLSVVETIETEVGKRDVMNSWAFASVIWLATVDGNNNANQIVNSLFGLNQQQFSELLSRSKKGDKAAIRQAIAILATAIEEKAEQAFS